jgi:hypothetical protein
MLSTSKSVLMERLLFNQRACCSAWNAAVKSLLQNLNLLCSFDLGLSGLLGVSMFGWIVQSS